MPQTAKVTRGTTQDRKRLGPYSRGLHRAAIGQIVDGRSREGRFLRAYEAMLVQHLGGAPNGVQRQLIARAARLALYVEIMDERSLAAGGMSDRDSASYLAWSNSLRRTLLALGVNETGTKRHNTLNEYLSQKTSRRQRAAEAREPAA